MAEIRISELTLYTWREASELDVEDSQRGFVAPNLRSIALSRFLPDWTPAAIYNGDTMVGFAFYGPPFYGPPAPHTWHILRFMIDKRHQGKGYGKAAMRELIRIIKEKAPDCRVIELSYVPENVVARKVYADLGFKETGELDHGEVVAALELAPEG